ncbi:sensor histidine kinase [Haloferula sp.]|uniref:sensor histidine kinase n=1 Tax=Haloferula sp. TaxID=2497595 RepID=UPI003C728FCA
MKARSAWGVWAILFVCAALILGAMAWLTREVVAAERERTLADARADLQERIRLSLWRMDSVAAALMIEENQRTGRAVGLIPENPLVKVRFRVIPSGEVVTESDDVERVQQLNELLSTSERFGNRFQMMCAVADEGGSQWGVNAFAAVATEDAKGPRQSVDYQLEANLKERAVRGGLLNNTVGKSGLVQQLASPMEPPLTAAGMFQPAWIGGEAFLIRSMVAEGGGVGAMEGAWLDTSAFRRMLTDEVVDLLPTAEVKATEPGVADALALASFPIKLVPGEEAVASAGLRGPLVSSLMAGWVAAGAALLAGAALVHAVMKLSERRASFVSAVTHELRTPLTTFRLYSEMLDSGAVSNEKKRSGYYKTLRREADRLSHMVENVLAFSRIEKGSARSAVNCHSLEELLDGMRERFEDRLAGAGMVLKIDRGDDLSIRGDAAAVEHILFNLIDNAAKYAISSKSNEVLLKAAGVGDRVEIGVCDQGNGIPEDDRKTIFRAFHKSAQEAAESKPGVGLGLALSSRLAKQMGGSLSYRGGRPGACFVLSLPKG